MKSDAKCNAQVRSALGLTCTGKRRCHFKLYASDGEWENLKLAGGGVQVIAAAVGRSASTISRELQRNALDHDAYRPLSAEGAYLLRRQRLAKLERDSKLRNYVPARLSEGWTPEQICERLHQGIERGRGLISTEAIYARIYSKARMPDRLWRSMPRGRPRLGRRQRPSKDHISEKTPISERTETAKQREVVGHLEADLVICKRSRLVVVLRRSITFDNGGLFACHALLRDMLSATTYFCDAYASWQKGGVENTNGRIRRWLPRFIDLDEFSDKDIQEIAMTLNSTPRKCLDFKTPIEAMLAELGKDVPIRFA